MHLIMTVCHPWNMPVLLVQRRLHWIGHAARRIEGELIKDLLLPKPTRTWRRRAGGQLMTWATTNKADLEQRSLSSAVDDGERIG